jgi:hypothetical protein
MQDDWAQWIPMVEFSDNNNTSSSSKLTPFYFNRGFHPRMSFDPDTTTYETTRERLLATKAEDITKKMEEILEYGRKNLAQSQLLMERQANRHRKDVEYQPGQKVWLSSKNINSTRPCRDLEDKQYGPYEVVEKVGGAYRLRLPDTARIGDVFSPKLLRPCAEDPLPGQAQDPPRPVDIHGEDEYEVDDILDSRRRYGRLQYKVKWHGLDRDDEWYFADQGEFESSQDVVDEYHRRYPKKPRPR